MSGRLGMDPLCYDSARSLKWGVEKSYLQKVLDPSLP